MSNEVTVLDSVGNPILYLRDTGANLRMEFEHVDRSGDLEIIQNIPAKEFPKIIEKFGFPKWTPILKLAQEVSNRGEGVSLRDFLKSSEISKSIESTWLSFGD